MKFKTNIYVIICMICFIFDNACCRHRSSLISDTTLSTIEAGLSPECYQSMKLLTRKLNETNEDDDDIWALKMLDATSKIPVGLLSFNFGEMGSFKQCIDIISRRDKIMGKYCLNNIAVNTSSIDNEYVMSHIYVKNIMSRISSGINMLGDPTWAICIPSNCSDDDVIHTLNMTDTLGMRVESVLCQTKDDVYPKLDTDAIIGISILSFLLLLVISSTTLDIYVKFISKGTISPLYISFSLYTNGKDLFQIPKRNSILSCLDGIKVLSMLWIVILHTYSVYTTGPVFNSKDVIAFTDSIVSMFFISGDLACDTFLIVGGTLVTYVFFRKKEHDVLGVKAALKHYLHRYIRLTPALAGVVLVSATLLLYLGSGPKWSYITNSFQGFCKSHWWSALLYVQNIVNVDTMCAGHTWYLNVDMQLYIMTPAIFWLLRKFTNVGVFTLVLATICSVIISFVRGYNHEMSAISSNYFHKTASSIYMNEYYLRTETRAAPWLIGTILGFILTREKYTNVKLRKVVNVPIWILSLAVILVCTLGGHIDLRGPDYRRAENALYIAFVRPTFALSVGWIIWACATKNGGMINSFLSSKLFKFLNKFIYSMYLLHVTCLYMIIFSNKTSIYFTVFNLAYWFWGIFMFMFALSTIWVLVFESPMIALEKIIFPPDLQLPPTRSQPSHF